MYRVKMMTFKEQILECMKNTHNAYITHGYVEDGLQYPIEENVRCLYKLKEDYSSSDYEYFMLKLDSPYNIYAQDFADGEGHICLECEDRQRECMIYLSDGSYIKSEEVRPNEIRCVWHKYLPLKNIKDWRVKFYNDIETLMLPLFTRFDEDYTKELLHKALNTIYDRYIDDDNALIDRLEYFKEMLSTLKKADVDIQEKIKDQAGL